LRTKEKFWEEKENAFGELSSDKGLRKNTSSMEGKMKVMQRSRVTSQ